MFIHPMTMNETVGILMKSEQNKSNTNLRPTGECVIQTIAMPANTNSNGDIFGGWLLSQMDLGGAVLAYKKAQGRIVTKAIAEIVFYHPVKVGATVACYANLERQGQTSLTIAVESWSTPRETMTPHLVNQGIFTYVAIDEQGKPRAIS